MTYEELAKNLDEKLSAMQGYTARDIQRSIETMLKTGQVEIGWRECCGKTDFTAKIHSAWEKLISNMKKYGFVISEERVKHDNRYATANGGFWNSIIYKIEKRP